MAFFLPPVIPPQQATPAELRPALSSGRILTVKTLRLHLIGAGGIPDRELRQALQAANSPSDVVLEVARLLYLHVSPAMRADYAMVGAELYVICVPQRIKSVTGTSRLRPFFKNLEGATAPSGRRLEEDRVFAELYSQRAALDSGLKLQQEAGSTVVLDALAVDTGDKRFHASADYTNAGNRFVGRNIVGADLRYDDRTAHEYRLTWKHALQGGKETGSAGRYDEAQAGWSSVSPVGLWQLTAHGFYFTQDMSAGKLNGRFIEGNLAWAGVAYADWSTRSLFQLRGSYADRASESAAAGATVFAERYAYLEPSLTYSGLHEFANSRLNLDAALSLSAGTLLSDPRLTQASRSLQLGRVSLHPEWKHQDWGSVGLNLYCQYSPNRLPEELQLVLGGPSALAAYLPGAVFGDSGMTGRLYWERKIVEFPSFDLKARLYAEYGAGRIESSTSGGAATSMHGADAGGGLTAEAGKLLTVSVDLAQAFSRAQTSGADVPGVYASVSLHN